MGWLLLSAGIAFGGDMVSIEGGSYLPLYGDPETPVQVEPFALDVHPVTNAEMLVFVEEHPRWQRTDVAPLFAEKAYLSHWEGNTELGALAPPDSPVTQVSWFAAKAYCEAQDKRLPTLDEWEYVARASDQVRDASKTAEHTRRILDWYADPSSLPLPSVGSRGTNVWGVADVHGLVWEWVLDFGSVLMTGESRKDGSLDRALYCAGGSLGSVDPSDYAAFMRYAMRAGLKGNYTLQNLGFRCAKDIGS